MCRIMKMSPVQTKKSNGTKRHMTETKSFPHADLQTPISPCLGCHSRNALGVALSFFFFNKMGDIILTVLFFSTYYILELLSHQ